jgi:predicted small secreted protein
MPYIGKQPTVGNFQVCDAISVVDGQAAYTMQVGGSNVEPENANHMLVSLNGILQKPGSSFTISGSTITFASNLATGDVIDFITLLGDTLNTGAPSDDTVTAAKINNDVISGQTELAATPADTDELLISDAGTIKRIDFSHLKTGITMADQWRLSTTLLLTDSNQTLANNERVDSDGYGQLGTGMSHSSGIFTFPSTGIYLITVQAYIYRENSGTGTASIQIETTTDNSSYGGATNSVYTVENVSAYAGNVNGSFIFDVTDTSTHKVRFAGNCTSSNIAIAYADSNSNTTAYTFIRLGDT